MKPIIIGMAGGTGSGKTYTVNKLLNSYPKNYIINIEQDSYYKDLSDIDYKERTRKNFDHPESIDIDLFQEDLKQLSAGFDITIPIYDFFNHIRVNECKVVPNAKIIIVEGIFALYYPQLRKLYDIKIFIEAPEKVRFKRRLNRDVKERGRTIQSIKKQYTKTVLPMYKKFIEPSKKYADLIINGNDNIKNNLNTIKTRIDSLLS